MICPWFFLLLRFNGREQCQLFDDSYVVEVTYENVEPGVVERRLASQENQEYWRIKMFVESILNKELKLVVLMVFKLFYGFGFITK